MVLCSQFPSQNSWKPKRSHNLNSTLHGGNGCRFSLPSSRGEGRASHVSWRKWYNRRLPQLWTWKKLRRSAWQESLLLTGGESSHPWFSGNFMRFSMLSVKCALNQRCKETLRNFIFSGLFWALISPGTGKFFVWWVHTFSTVSFLINQMHLLGNREGL